MDVITYAPSPEWATLATRPVHNQIHSGTGDFRNPHTPMPRLYLTDSVQACNIEPARTRLRID